ncbi:MAG: aa3-type cytochrome oxidase subunit CtaJ [Mycobacterium sp.]
MEILLYFVGIPLLLVTVLAVLIWSHRGPHPATYRMSEPWTHPPILWAAIDEVIGGQHGHGGPEFSVGGGASGKW